MIFRYALVQAITLVMACTVMQAQQCDKNWLLGNSNGTPPFRMPKLIFTTTSLTVDTMTRILSMDGSYTSISDSIGNLQFYTNGEQIADKSNHIMNNSAGFNMGFENTIECCGLVQFDEVIALPKPDKRTKYGIFHTVYDTVKLKGFSTTLEKSIHLYYTEIDMSLNGGNGEVIKKNIHIIDDTLITGLLAACKHGNGRDWWVITHRVFSNKYYKILFSPDKIIVADTQVITGDVDSSDFVGQAVFSPDGAHYAIATQDNRVRLFDFDRCNGELNNYRWDTIPRIPNQITFDYIRGCSFSPNSKYLYVDIGESIYQYDLTDTSFRTSRVEVAKWVKFKSPFNTYFSENRLAPDGKIYVGTSAGCWVLHMIDSPDVKGVGCHVLQNCIKLDTNNSGNSGLPNFANYRLGALKGSGCDTVTGMDDIYDKMYHVKIFPSPAISNCIVEYQLPQNFSGYLEIYNVLGERVCEQRLPQWSIMQNIDVRRFAPGLYYVRISCNQQTVNTKFVVAK